MAWSIEAAVNSKVIDRVIVSTDDKEIANVAKNWGAEVPFMRPTELAQDTSSSFSVIEHTLNWLEREQKYVPDYFVLLEPTSPLRDAKDVDKAFDQLKQSNASSIVGICLTDVHHPVFMYRKSASGKLNPYLKNSEKDVRRQDLEHTYFLEGSIYISQTKVLLKKKTFYHENTIGYEVPKWKSPEIDNEIDFLLAEVIMKHKNFK
jgi:N-acylneuraminate cytidylyltransferase/CMP-N,N'-diacetyllegionaminic acid synthase